jgi:hypothetical protein
LLYSGYAITICSWRCNRITCVVAEEKLNAYLKRKKYIGILLLKKRLAPVILERKLVRTVFFKGFLLVKDSVLLAR